MAEVHRLDAAVTVAAFTDERGQSRHLRATWHPELGVVVLSIWQAGRCTATFRLPIAEAPRLVELLSDGLADADGP